MPINYDELMQAKSEGITSSYRDRETMLYALGIGFMRDPLNADELPFVYENGLKTVPTMATVIGWGQGTTLANSGINYHDGRAWRAAPDHAQAACRHLAMSWRTSVCSACSTRAKTKAPSSSPSA